MICSWFVNSVRFVGCCSEQMMGWFDLVGRVYFVGLRWFEKFAESFCFVGCRPVE